MTRRVPIRLADATAVSTYLWILRDRDQGRDDLVERPARIQLVRAVRPEQRLDRREVLRIRSRSSGDLPKSFVVRCAIRSRITSAGALSSTTASNRS
jgi:hypothetical protein